MVRWISWISRRITGAPAALAGVGVLLASSAAPAQTTGGASLGTLGSSASAGTGAASSSSAGGGTTNASSQNANLITNLGPSTGMGPQITIGGQTAANRGPGGTGTTNNIPSSSNPLGPYFFNPYQFGITTVGGSPSNQASGSSQFGQPLYGTATTTTTGTAGTGQTANIQGTGFSTLNRSRAPAYYTALSPDMEFAPHPPAKLQSDLQQLMRRLSAFRDQNIQVQVVNGDKVILRGEVRSPRDRERAEAQVRITPGVDDVVNQLTITGTAGTSGTPIQRASN